MFPNIYSEIKDRELASFIADNIGDFKSDFEFEFDSLERKLGMISLALNTAKEINKAHLNNTWNLLGYVNTCLFDLAVTSEAIMFESDPWKKRYHARMAILNMYEAAQDLPNMFGKGFRDSFDGVNGGQEFLLSLGRAVKKVNKFKSTNAVSLKSVRLNMAAHRDQNLDEQLKVVFNIDPIEVLKLMTEFGLIIKELEQSLNNGVHLV
ncbi:hypothetical protein P3544_19455 [Vibrio parahaemolyticus]|nr:hypothetical protein [Vibrio parahaemolyticus]MDF4715329.1 hypothetical protein [Vibrio parahaemolyticus]